MILALLMLSIPLAYSVVIYLDCNMSLWLGLGDVDPAYHMVCVGCNSCACIFLSAKQGGVGCCI